MRGRIAACSERLLRCEVAGVSPQSSESALAGRRHCVSRRLKSGGGRRQNRQYCGCFIPALTHWIGVNPSAETNGSWHTCRLTVFPTQSASSPSQWSSVGEAEAGSAGEQPAEE